MIRIIKNIYSALSWILLSDAMRVYSIWCWKSLEIPESNKDFINANGIMISNANKSAKLPLKQHDPLNL